jgi:hypothetical protein
MNQLILEQVQVQENYIYDPSVNLKENKAAYMWIFDEVIGKNSIYDGNNVPKAFRDIEQIMEFIDTNNTDFKEEITNFLSVLRNNTYFIIDDNFIININNNFISFMENHKKILIIGGWPGHLITLFIHKNLDDTYNFGIINAGQGVEYQGISNELCNGIMIYTNIMSRPICEFLTQYNIWYKFIISINNITGSYYTFFYDLLKLKLKLTNEPEYIVVNSQLIGNCTLVNNVVPPTETVA